MTQFLKSNAFEYHVNGDYINRVDRYSIKISSVFEDAKDPNGHRNLINLNLTGEEFDTLLDELWKIRYCIKNTEPLEDDCPF